MTGVRLTAFLLGHQFGREYPESSVDEARQENPYSPRYGERSKRAAWFEGYIEATETVARQAAEAA